MSPKPNGVYLYTVAEAAEYLRISERTMRKIIAECAIRYRPVLSVDTKKKEFLGGLYRDGKLYSQDGVPLERYDHDFPHLAEGRVVPHGIFDLNLNKGFITLGTSAETPAFVAESLGLWWNYRGRHDYRPHQRTADPEELNLLAPSSNPRSSSEV